MICSASSSDSWLIRERDVNKSLREIDAECRTRHGETEWGAANWINVHNTERERERVAARKMGEGRATYSRMELLAVATESLMAHVTPHRYEPRLEVQLYLLSLMDMQRTKGAGGRGGKSGDQTDRRRELEVLRGRWSERGRGKTGYCCRCR